MLIGMTIKILFWSVLGIVTLIVVPAVMIWSMIDHFRGRGSDRRGGGGISSGVGAALQELDRLVTRPSVEHQIEAENHHEREDDQGGD
jgi:hypothetical protein